MTTTYTGQIDVTSPTFFSDPFPIYRRLREAAPVCRTPQGSWMVTRYQDCVAVLQDDRLTNIAEDRCYPDKGENGSTRNPMDSRYGDTRKLVSRALSPALMRAFEVTVRRPVDELLDAALDAGDVDVVADLANPLAAVVICDVFGMPAEDRGRFRKWVDTCRRESIC
ncbi:MAG: cytochrome P450 [Micromonosporaceae bacterium]